MEFVNAVTAGSSVKFLPAVYISPFSLIFLFFPLKLLKLGEIDGVKFIAGKSGGVNFSGNNAIYNINESTQYILP